MDFTPSRRRLGDEYDREGEAPAPAAAAAVEEVDAPAAVVSEEGPDSDPDDGEERAHDDMGHASFTATVENLRDVAIPEKAKCVEEYVGSCMACQFASAPRTVGEEGAPRWRAPTRPWERVILDIYGDMEAIEGDNGERYIITMTDVFTRWTEMGVSTSREAYKVRDFFEERCNTLLDFPREVQMDNDKSFLGVLIFGAEADSSAFYPRVRAAGEWDWRAAAQGLDKAAQDAAAAE